MKKTFESKGMKVNLGKTRLMVSGIDEETPDSKVDLCGICESQYYLQYVVNGCM